MKHIIFKKNCFILQNYAYKKIKIALWDKDIIGSDDLIGECVIDLNGHKMIDKSIYNFIFIIFFFVFYFKIKNSNIHF